MKRITALIVCILMLASLASGCSCAKKPSGGPTPEPGTTSLPTKTPDNGQSGTEHDPAVSAAFNDLAKRMFIDGVTSDGYSFHQLVTDPASFGIREEDVERGWGPYSLAAHEEDCREDGAYREELQGIDRNKLTDQERIAYDNLVLMLDMSIAVSDYYYYKEPLTPFNGEHTTLPLVMSMYKIENKKDAENYLYLLYDMPRYLDDIAQFEVEKASQGLFMTENALDQVLESCRKMQNEGDELFVISYFEEAIADPACGITAVEQAALNGRCRDLVTEGILPAYGRLAETLEDLRGSCHAMKGAAERSEGEARYFDLQIRNEAALNVSSADMADLLDKTTKTLFNRLSMLVMTDPDAASSFGGRITSGDHLADVEYLISLIDGVYPEIPAQSIDYVTIPDAVADDFSPAAYLISAFDDPGRNVVMFNPTADNRTMLFTLAHECFPGHLYQTQYFRNSDIPLIQQLLTPTGYSEGWAVFSELMIAGMAEQYGTGSCLLEQYNDIICNILIPSYISIKVNTESWDKARILKYLKHYGLGEESYADIIYEYAVDVPLYFFNYSMGFVNTFRIYEKAAPSTDAQKLAFLTEYLNYGPSCFDILNEKFGVK